LTTAACASVIFCSLSSPATASSSPSLSPITECRAIDSIERRRALDRHFRIAAACRAKQKNATVNNIFRHIESKQNRTFRNSGAYHTLLIVSIRVTRAVNRRNSIAKLALDVVVSDVVVDVEFAKRTAYRSTLESTTKTTPIENTTRRFPT
jgi:hypothetical protein